MPKKQNPTAVARGRVQDIKGLARLDVLEPNHFHPEFQPDLLAVAAIMRRFGMSFHHAQVVCQLSGLGGSHA